jgi:probable HAF family extracellular repeat protein
MPTYTSKRNFLSAILVLALVFFAGAGSSSSVLGPTNAEAAPPQGHVASFVSTAEEGYVADFVSTAAFGVAMNDSGDVTGTSYPDPGCGSFCLPTLETVVWRGGDRIVLPAIPGLTGIYVNGINNEGWVTGLAGFPGTTTHAVVWQPNGNEYEAIDLGTLPGTTISYAVGIDDLGRVVGWSTTSNFPPQGSPFMWSESTGMVDLSAEGFPDEIPLAISPGGTVATVFTWYQLGDPNSVVAMPSPPQGFGIGGEPTAINDAGDQARFLISTSGQNLRYLFRFHNEGTWQQISLSGSGHLSRYGVGSINDAGDVTATVVSTGVIAFGPDGLAQSLAPLLSPAYGGSEITDGGPMNSAGQILTQVMIGRSQRLVRLIPAQACLRGCLRISDLAISASFIEDPHYPGYCFEGGIMYNEALVSLTVTRRNGAPVEGVLVSGRFLDDYWTSEPVSGITDNSGVVSFPYTGLCGVGAIAFLVDDATGGNLVFDRTVGILTDWAIPQ